MIFLFYLLVAAHHILVWANILSMLFLPFNCPWYIAFPLETFLFNLLLNPVFKDCPLTKLECVIRKQIGLPPIKSFIAHYYIKPYFRLKKFYNEKTKPRLDDKPPKGDEI